MTAILCPIRASARQQPNATAIISPNGRHTYLDIDQMVSVITSRLRSEGIESGDHVVVEATTNYRTIAILFALFRVGAIAVVSGMPQSELELLRGKINPKLVLVERLLFPTPVPMRTFLDIDSGDIEGIDDGILSCDQPAVIVPTSGTTSEPKLAVLSVGNFYYSAMGLLDVVCFEPGHRWLVSVPLYHVSGLSIIFRTFFATATLVIPEKKYSLLESIYTLQVTHLSLVPTQLKRLLNDPAFTPRARWPWHTIMVSGSEIPHPLVTKALANQLPMIAAYGLTETGSAITIGTPSLPGDSGTCLPFRSIRTSPTGEIEVSGKTLFLGYLEHNGIIRLPLTSDGWFRTGDVGYHVNGRWIIAGRTDDMFISGGENIHPSAVEDVIRTEFLVDKLMVIGIPDSEYGHRPVVFCEPPIQLEVLRSRLIGKLQKFKIPIAVLDWKPEMDNDTKLSRSKWKALAISEYRRLGGNTLLPIDH